MQYRDVFVIWQQNVIQFLELAHTYGTLLSELEVSIEDNEYVNPYLLYPDKLKIENIDGFENKISRKGALKSTGEERTSKGQMDAMGCDIPNWTPLP